MFVPPSNQYEIWIAGLNPQIGTEPGKTRPVLVIQTDLLNEASHPSTIMCPITTNIQQEADILRVHIEQEVVKVRESCDIMIDQIRAIDNKRLVKEIGRLPQGLIEKVQENLKIVLDL